MSVNPLAVVINRARSAVFLAQSEDRRFKAQLTLVAESWAWHRRPSAKRKQKVGDSNNSRKTRWPNRFLRSLIHGFVCKFGFVIKKICLHFFLKKKGSRIAKNMRRKGEHPTNHDLGIRPTSQRASRPGRAADRLREAVF
jgi:hypothetical protein